MKTNHILGDYSLKNCKCVLCTIYFLIVLVANVGPRIRDVVKHELPVASCKLKSTS